MILELALLNVRPGENAAFERACPGAANYFLHAGIPWAPVAALPGITVQVCVCSCSGKKLEITPSVSANTAISGMEGAVAPFLRPVPTGGAL